MEYKVESLPGAVAAALTAFVSQLGGSADVLSASALAVGADEASHYLGLVSHDTKAEDVPRSAFSATVRDGTLVPGPLPAGVALQQIRVIPGPVARCLVVAMAEHGKAHPTVPLANVMWRVSDAIVVAMMVPALADGETDVIGGATSLGPEVQYHVDSQSFSVVRTTFAR